MNVLIGARAALSMRHNGHSHTNERQESQGARGRVSTIRSDGRRRYAEICFFELRDNPGRVTAFLATANAVLTGPPYVA